MKNFGKEQLILKSNEVNGDISVCGHASVFGVIDHHNDIIIRGAFKNSLNSKKDSVKFLWQHDASCPIGRIDELFEDDKGLYISANITSGTIKGREAIDLVSKRIINGLSIGFNVLKSHLDDNQKRVITDLDLWEVSLVTFPSNPKAELLNDKLSKSKLLVTLKALESQIKSTK